jgi:hypothetical protein
MTIYQFAGAILLWVITAALVAIPLLVAAMFLRLDPEVWMRRVFICAAVAGAVLTYLLLLSWS